MSFVQVAALLGIVFFLAGLVAGGAYKSGGGTEGLGPAANAFSLLSSVALLTTAVAVLV